jgi:cytochrome c6
MSSPRRRPSLSEAAAEGAVMLIVIGLLFVAGFVGWVIGHNVGGPTKTVTVGSASSATATTSSAQAGKTVFVSAGCGGCHTLHAAGAGGTVGPNLDQRKPSLDRVVERVTDGRRAMPSFKSRLTPQQIRDVAAFVYRSTH